MLRVQSPEGTRRVDVESGTLTKELFEKVLFAASNHVQHLVINIFHTLR